MYAEVSRTERLSPEIVRIPLPGGDLSDFDEPKSTDAYINARFLPVNSPIAVPFDATDLEKVSGDERPRPRRFTVRRWDRIEQRLVIDFVTHGPDGYAGSWAERARPGDRLQFEGPGGSYRPSPDVDWHLLVGAESAFGAIGATLESLSRDERASVFVVVERPGSEIDFPSVGDVDVSWVYREGAAEPAALLADAVADATLPAGTFDVFVHGEASEVRAVRKHLASDRGVDVGSASISPYWRRQHTDEAWRAVKREWIAELANDV
ncbi:MAG: siderophore-interacting protein [Ilumatobacter sp.]